MLKELGTHSQYKPSIYLFPMCLLWHFSPLCTLSSSINSTKHSPLGLPSRENVKWTPCSPSTISTSSVRVKEVNIFYSNFLWSNVLQTLQKIIYLQKKSSSIYLRKIWQLQILLLTMVIPSTWQHSHLHHQFLAE